MLKTWKQQLVAHQEHCTEQQKLEAENLAKEIFAGLKGKTINANTLAITMLIILSNIEDRIEQKFN